MGKRFCQFSECKKEFPPVKGRFNQRTCDNIDCARGYVREKELLKVEKEAKKAERETKEVVKAFREQSKSLNDYKASLQTCINKIVRLIDKGHPCISSGLTNYTVHAGHFISRGSDDTLRFHLYNIWAQSDSDNLHNGGNPVGMRAGIKNTFGPEILEVIDSLKSSFPSIHLDKADCVEARIIANKIIKELEEENRIYSTKERITLRNKFNERLNIYTN